MRLATALFCFAVLMAAPSTGTAQDNLLGAKWKLNLEKSKFSRSSTEKQRPELRSCQQEAFRVTTEGVIEAATLPQKGSFGPYKLDGRPYPVAGVAAYDASSFKMASNKDDGNSPL